MKPSFPNQISDIGIIILAAGSSRRFKGDKRKSIITKGRGLLQSTLANIPDSFSKKLLVLHPGDEEFGKTFETDWQIFIANDATHGIGSSLANAIQFVNDWQAAIIGLGDMPFITPKTYSALQQCLKNKEIVVPVCKGKRGNPVGFNASFFSELGDLTGDKGAKRILEAHAKQCYRYDCEDEGIFNDIDTQIALEKLSSQTA